MSLDQELRSALQRAADGCEPSMPDPDALITGGRLMRRQQRFTRMLAGAAAVAVATLGISLSSWINEPDDLPVPPADSDPTPPQQDPTQTSSRYMPFFLDLTTGKQTPVPPGLAPDGIGTGTAAIYPYYDVSPDGRWVAIATCHSSTCSGLDKFFVASLDGSNLQQVLLPEDMNAYRPDWSPDGTKLVYQLRDGWSMDVGKLVVRNVANGQTTELATDLEPTTNWWTMCPRFSPDGTTVIFQLAREDDRGYHSDVWAVSVQGGEPELLLSDAAYPVYLSGGDIAFVGTSAVGGGSSIQIADARGHRRVLVEATGPIRWLSSSPDGARITYWRGGSIHVVEVSAGQSSEVAVGESAEWVDEDTLLVSPWP